MSANLYKTKNPGEFYHIHGSLEATTTLNMIGLEGHRTDLTDYEDIIKVIEEKVQKYSVSELEAMNKTRRQAGVQALKYEDFIKTTHVSGLLSGRRHLNAILITVSQGKLNVQQPPWTVTPLQGNLPPTPFPTSRTDSRKILEGVKVLEMCRIIAGPTVTRILAEYGADVLKITSPNLSDVPFFQVDGNMGKHAADLDLKTEAGRQEFEKLLADVDVIVDGYRPDALEKLGYGPKAMAEMAAKCGKGIVYVNENCFGYEGEWAGRAGWQQIADCVSVLIFSRVHMTDLRVGNWYRLGSRPVHGRVNTSRAPISHFRLWNRVYGSNRRSLGTLPPRQEWRVLPRKGFAHAIRSSTFRRGPVFRGSTRATACYSATRVLPAATLRQCG